MYYCCIIIYVIVNVNFLKHFIVNIEKHILVSATIILSINVSSINIDIKFGVDDYQRGKDNLKNIIKLIDNFI